MSGDILALTAKQAMEAIHAGELDAAELFQPYRQVVAIRDDLIAILVGIHQLTARLQREHLMRPDDGARRHVLVPVPQRRFDLVDANLTGGQRMRIELRVHCVLLSAEHLHLRNPAHLRNALGNPRFRVLV